MKRILFILSVIVAATIPSMAQSMSALLIPTDAKSLSMGSVSVVPESSNEFDADAIFGIWAPATASNTIAGMDVRCRLSDKFGLLFDGTYFKDKPYVITNSEGQSNGTFSPTEMLFGLGGRLGLSEKLSLELKAKIFNSTIGNDLKGNAFGADLTLGYRSGGFNAAAGVANLGSAIKFADKSYGMPMMARAGASYTVSGITAAVEADYLFSGAFMAGLGAEYSIKDIAFIRAGFHYGDKTSALPTFASLGAGIVFSGIKLNIAYITANGNIGNSIMLSLGYCF